MDAESKKKTIISYLLDNKVLPQPALLQSLNNPEHAEHVYQQVLNGIPASILVHQPATDILPAPAPAATSLQVAQTSTNSLVPRVKPVFNYKDKPKKRTPQDFVQYFTARYRAIEKILQQRQELQNLTSIARLQHKTDRETASVIGIVSDKQITKNDNIILKIEDLTGSIKVMIGKNKQETYNLGRDIVLDEVIGLTGTTGNNIIFANSIILPDVPLTAEIKKSPDECYVAVLSCVHVGSRLFLRDSFEKFIRWLNCETGTEQQRAIAQKVGYVVIAGDLVDGVGIYPGQEKELELLDIYDQYDEAARLLGQIPNHIPLIIVPGNHDAGRISEPQQPMSPVYAKALYSLPNAVLLSNPCIVNIHSSETFPGFDFLVYHGFSFDDYAEIVPSIKNSAKNTSERTPMIMKFLLQRRHLAPQHSSTLYVPDSEKDPLVIERVPDFFIGGHIHKSNAGNYRGVGIVCGSCFQAKTAFQEKMGHEPDPGAVPLINLQTRQVTIMRF